MSATEKQCTHCFEYKDPSAFRARRKECRACAARIERQRRDAMTPAEREQYLWRRARYANENVTHRTRYAENIWKCYRLTVEDVARKANVQGMCCAICREGITFDSKTHVDHDHSTGRFRGMLCHYCNLLLGHAGDNSETLQAAIRYLENR